MESQPELPQVMEDISPTANNAMQAANNESPLLRIPLEVLLLISSYLTTQEYGNLRRICRHTEISLFKEFSSEFFAKRSFMLTEHSLATLVDISQSRLSSSLIYLIISLKNPSTAYQNLTDIPTAPATPVDVAAAVQHNRLREEIVGHQTLIDSCYDLELLTEALRNLPNLRTVGLRDFDSAGRHRDWSGHWRPYGAQTLWIEAGCDVQSPRSYQSVFVGQSQGANYVSRTFLTLLRALGNTKGPNTPPRLEVILRQCHVPNSAFNIPHRLEPTILPVLKDLKTIFLELGPSSFTEMVTADLQYCPGFLLTMFLSKLTSLERLRLNFRDCVENQTNSLFRWLTQLSKSLNQNAAMNSMLPQIPQVPTFQALEQLDLGMVIIELPILVNLIKRFKSSLRRISLHKVTLHNKTASSSSGRVNFWAKLINQLCKVVPQLAAINFSFLKQINHRSAFHVSFINDSCNPDAKSPTKAWAGMDFRRDSKDIIESMFVAWPGANGAEDSLSSGSESDDDDVDDDEDDDLGDNLDDGHDDNPLDDVDDDMADDTDDDM
ncbi:hypothetical protein GGS26DRAFT_547840 [Hypomontagnella submonticulosa]|nr:hypothetical protein GGS26DRAFT_547840 [Hypomontagnella submonticulosa]